MFAGRAVRILIHAYRLCLVGTGSTVLCVPSGVHIQPESGATWLSIKNLTEAASKQLNISGIKSVVIHLGTNDVTRHDSGETILNVTSAIDHAKEKFPKAGIAIASVPPRRGSERSQKKANEATASVNSYLQAMSRRTKTVHYIDTHTLLAPKGYPLGHLY